MIFLVLFGKIMFLFLENMILTLDRKWKMIFFQKKNTRKYDIFLRSSEKKVFSKQKTAPRHDLSCIIWRDGIFFPKTRYFFLGQEASDDLPQEIHGYMMFSVYKYGCYKPGVTPSCQKKNQRWSYPAKIHLKVIDFLDWHPGKSSNNSLYLHRDLYGRFHVMLSSQKKQET